LLDGLKRQDGGYGAQVRLILPIVDDDNGASASDAPQDNQRALLH
jgi:hypothetical protein